jgi:flavin reductase (DIM6/NTAB) family NADH-FMN oxidoreductase RutF
MTTSEQNVPVDSGSFRQVLGHFPTGVVVITAIDPEGAPRGMAVGSFTSVSLDPPLVAFLPGRSSTSFPKIRRSGRFCVNVLSHYQEHICRAMAAKGTDKFGQIAWTPAPITGSPVISDGLAWIDCAIDTIHEAGDHYIVIGHVLALGATQREGPLIFFQGGFGRFFSS